MRDSRLREKAVELRKQGLSLNEIYKSIGIAKSTASLWLRNVPLPEAASSRLQSNRLKGSMAAVVTNRRKRIGRIADAESEAQKILRALDVSQNFAAILSSVIYWCEGAKLYNDHGGFGLTNSDPRLIRAFLKLFRSAFVIDETKFRVYVHLHSYHSEKKQIDFWSSVTGVPKSQFRKSFIKQESGITKRESYQGCIMLRYNDKMMLRKILAIAETFFVKIA